VQILYSLKNRIGRTSKIFWWLVLLFIFTVPISQFISVRLAIVVLFFSFFVSQGTSSNYFLRSWDILLYLIILGLGLVYTENLEQGLRVIETNFIFFALPLIFYKIGNFNIRKSYQIFYAFTTGLFAASLISLANSILQYSETADVRVFFFYQLTQALDFHPTYFGYYLIFSITYGLYIIYYGSVRLNPYWINGILVFLFFMLMLTGSQTAYISLLLVFSFFVLKYLLGEKSRKETGVVIFVFIMTACMFSLILNFQQNKQFLSLGDQNDYWERFTLWDAALRANPSPLFGVGTGDYKTILNQYYQSQGMALFAEESYNSHNQFIQIYFSNGFFGLLALCIIICRPLYLSFKVQNPIGILIIFPFIIYGVTEVFLGRFQGIVFFVFCHQLVIAQYYLIKPKLILSKEDELST